MKPTHFLALSTLGFVAGAVFLAVGRGYFDPGVRPATHSPGTAPTNADSAAKPQVDDAAEAERNFRLGSEAVERKDYDLAISYLNEAIRLRPTYFDAIGRRYVANCGSHKLSAAVADTNLLIQLAADDTMKGKAYWGRALAEWEMRDLDNSVRDCSEAIRLGFGDISVYFLRGEVYREKGEFDQAIADCSTALRFDSGFDGAYETRGRAYFGKYMYENAIRDFSRALELKPSAERYSFRGDAYALMGDATAGARDGESALLLDPNCKDAHQLLALCYANLGDQRRASYHQQRFAQLGGQ